MACSVYWWRAIHRWWWLPREDMYRPSKWYVRRKYEYINTWMVVIVLVVKGKYWQYSYLSRRIYGFIVNKVYYIIIIIIKLIKLSLESSVRRRRLHILWVQPTTSFCIRHSPSCRSCPSIPRHRTSRFCRGTCFDGSSFIDGFTWRSQSFVFCGKECFAL